MSSMYFVRVVLARNIRRGPVVLSMMVGNHLPRACPFIGGVTVFQVRMVNGLAPMPPHDRFLVGL